MLIDVLTLALEIGRMSPVFGILNPAHATMLFGILRSDPVIYFGTVLLLSAVATSTSGLPAWRAFRIDLMTTLRYE